MSQKLPNPRPTKPGPPIAEMAAAEAIAARDGAVERLMDAINLQEALEKKTPKELVDLALQRVPDMPEAYEAIILELCSRVCPGWENDNADQA